MLNNTLDFTKVAVSFHASGTTWRRLKCNAEAQVFATREELLFVERKKIHNGVFICCRSNCYTSIKPVDIIAFSV